MRIFILAAIIGMISGCAIARNMNVGMEGKDIKTPYGTGDGNFTYNSTTCVGIFGGKCPNVK